MNQQNVRNFSIIAHIDHGKSTLADKLILKTGALEQRVFKDQYLDNMDLERERGITIKAQTVRLPYRSQKGDAYTFNMIDTPGHVDFSYEVSRSLAACEGVLLLIDASQGIQAQTIANVNLAMAGNLTIIPVINKVDLPSADPDMVREQLEDILQIDSTEAILASAKQGIGVEEIMEAIVERIPPPEGDPDQPLKALLFDAWYDLYKGVMILVRVVDGHLKEGMTIQMMATGHTFEVEELGAFTPVPKRIDRLSAGEVGFVIAGIKKLDETKIGDTVTEFKNNCDKPLPGYKDVKPMVFSGLYPIDGDQYENLRDALKKLRLNDASFTYEPETSAALGFGFRCGFLGLLHMEIVRERLEREYNVDLLTTAPTVVFHLKPEHGDMVVIDNPSNLKKQDRTDTILEPYLRGTIIVPDEYVGVVMNLARDRRGIQLKMEYLTPKTVMLQYALPFSEIVFDFFDHLKSSTKGYASFDYEFLDFRASDLVKLDILFNGETVDALSMIVHRDKAYYRGRELVKKLKEQIPRQMFEVAIQASIGGKVIARESVKALRKNVLAKCYGGDITRKRKLLEKQKAGKKRMKQIGKVEIPQEAFLAVLRTDVK
ncbi:GTP-binding protein LepA [Nitrospina gracilis 3/211]|uniref:Elongation factor 4 n=1 Tax=Nitrospina gracilis (strain 3/211) TaxID=1266370 RepID=M1YWY0_NITG3|nr:MULTISPECIES: translation elongation factor 4 [Nitrospina]MCF8722390.1 GTP-binding protein LepA [Nitrospina sp. Nb-3]CCQ90004.1 GTP-binding protein LepA [Nitrospina gracilis 3/211]